MTAAALAASLPESDTVSSHLGRQLAIGREYYTAGRIDQAIEAFQSGLAAVESEAARLAAVDTVSELHSNLGNACMISGDLEAAAANYKAALRLAPHLVSCWCNLGNALVQSGKPQDAIAYYVQALTLNPGHWPSRTNLVQALMATRQYLLAKVLLMELVEERPQDAAIHNRLGKLHYELNELEPALQCFRQAVALNPQDSDSIYWIGSIRQKMGDLEAAQAAYADAARINPLIRRPAAKYPADFRVLALFAPFAGNLPTDYLFSDAAYDTDTLALLAGSQFDAELLKQDVQVVVNLISDADQADGLLPLAA